MLSNLLFSATTSEALLSSGRQALPTALFSYISLEFLRKLDETVASLAAFSSIERLCNAKKIQETSREWAQHPVLISLIPGRYNR